MLARPVFDKQLDIVRSHNIHRPFDLSFEVRQIGIIHDVEICERHTGEELLTGNSGVSLLIFTGLKFLEGLTVAEALSLPDSLVAQLNGSVN